MINLVEYDLHTTKTAPTLGTGKLYRYVMGANGVFVYAKNDIFEAVIPIRAISRERDYVRGLEKVQTMFKIVKKIEFDHLRRIIDVSRSVLPLEALFYLKFADGGWIVQIPQQYQTRCSVTPKLDRDYIPVEVHSHNTMDAFFSSTDDADETGLRIYGVLGHLDRPVVDLKMRISIYGHRAIIPYHWVFENYYEVRDAQA